MRLAFDRHDRHKRIHLLGNLDVFSMIELPSTTTSDTNDEFFLERLDMFCNHTLLDAINSFAAREMRPVEQVNLQHVELVFSR